MRFLYHIFLQWIVFFSACGYSLKLMGSTMRTGTA